MMLGIETEVVIFFYAALTGKEFIFGGKWIVFCEIGVSFDRIWKS